MSDKSSKPSNSQERPNIWPTMLWVLLLAITLPWLLRMFSGQNQAANLVSYSDFRSQLREGNVSQVTIQGERVEGELIQPVQLPVVDGETAEIARFVTYVPQFGDPALLEELHVSNVEIVIRSADTFEWTTFFLTLLPFVLMIGLAIMLFRGMRSQTQNIFPIVKSGARQYDQNKSVKTTFDDVAGAEGAKRELQEIVEYLKRPDSFKRLGGQIPKGVLLVGPPGTGKTLLARAVAGEAGVPFLSITGSDFMEMFVGVGASRVRDLFSEAKKISPSIIFIDELDSVGRKRGTGLGGGHDEREQTLNQMLSEMDGFEPNENVIVMAATNRPDILDPALQRPGRFDRQVTVDLPTRKDRLEILQIHTRNKPLENDVDLDRIARGTPLFSGADLENLLNEAALLAARGGKNKIENEDVEEARDKVLMGLKRENLVLTGEEYRLLAYHEAGHAVLACMLPNADPLHKVTIVPRGRAMGVTQQLPERDRYLYPRDYITDRMAVMMGGRAAEVLVFSNITSGAEDDLKQATRMARKMVLDWGMSSRLGHIALGDHREHVFLGEEIAQGREYSETTAREVDEEVRSILKEAFDKALSVLQEQRHGLDRLVDALLEKEEVSGQEVMGIIHDLADQEAERPNDSQRIEHAGLPRLSPSAG